MRIHFDISDDQMDRASTLTAKIGVITFTDLLNNALVVMEALGVMD